jgi:hypothetical protein
MADKKPKLLERDLYTIDKSGRQTDVGLHDIDGDDDRNFREIMNRAYRTVSDRIQKDK